MMNKSWIKYGISSIALMLLVLGAFTNCQNFAGAGDGLAVGVADKTGQVCIQQIQYLFSPESRVCMYAADGCEAKVLKDQGYVEVSSSFCSAVQIDGDELVWVDLKAPTIRDTVCTTDYEIMIQGDLGLCAEGRSGCEIQYGRSLGFVPDNNASCPPK